MSKSDKEILESIGVKPRDEKAAAEAKKAAQEEAKKTKAERKKAKK